MYTCPVLVVTERTGATVRPGIRAHSTGTTSETGRSQITMPLLPTVGLNVHVSTGLGVCRSRAGEADATVHRALAPR
jgi:hypothetical protein